uniref:Uncharacterized protein n=1 Tax=Anguilla anguilla TaxID=7936 RepID=A0A0E9SUT9_ANGAN
MLRCLFAIIYYSSSYGSTALQLKTIYCTISESCECAFKTRRTRFGVGPV